MRSAVSVSRWETAGRRPPGPGRRTKISPLAAGDVAFGSRVRFEPTWLANTAKALKLQEVTALVLKAQGLSYKEIAEHQNLTYTKLNVSEWHKELMARRGAVRVVVASVRPQLLRSR